MLGQFIVETQTKKLPFSFQGAPWIPDYKVHLMDCTAQPGYKTKNTELNSIMVMMMLMI